MSALLDNLPDDWEFSTLGDLNTRKAPMLNPKDFVDETFEYYSIPDFQRDQRPSLTNGGAIESSKLLLKPKMVLFGKLNPRVEKVWRVAESPKFRQIGSTEWITILPNDRVDADFLYFLEWSDHVMPIAKTLVSGSTPSRQRVDPTSFYRLRVPLPPLPEQKKISHILSTVQRAIEGQGRIIQTTTELKKTLMHKLLTEGIRSEPQQQTEIGLIPESWEVVSFEKFVVLQRGYDLRKQDFRDGTVPVIGATQIIGHHDTAIVKGPGVTVVRSGSSAGKPLFISEDFWPHNVVLFVRDFHGNVPKFVYYKIQSLDLTRYRQGVAVPTLNRNTFRSIQTALPPREEQEQIADTLDSVETKSQVAARKKTALQDLFRALLHELMTAKTRVHNLELPQLKASA